MENVEKEMSSDTPQLISDKDPKAVVKATVFLVQKGIKDQVFSVRPWSFNFFFLKNGTKILRKQLHFMFFQVFSVSLEVLRSLVKNYIPQHK